MEALDKTSRLSPKQRAFLAAFAGYGSITLAARAAKCDRQAHYAWLKESAIYPAAFAEAEEQACANLEGEAYRRAHRGVEKVVTYQGKPVFYNGKPLVEHQFSDTLMVFLLKGMRPKKYRDNSSVEMTGKDGDPLFDVASVRAYCQAVEDKKP